MDTEMFKKQFNKIAKDMDSMQSNTPDVEKQIYTDVSDPMSPAVIYLGFTNP